MSPFVPCPRGGRCGHAQHYTTAGSANRRHASRTVVGFAAALCLVSFVVACVGGGTPGGTYRSGSPLLPTTVASAIGSTPLVISAGALPVQATQSAAAGQSPTPPVTDSPTTSTLRATTAAVPVTTIAAATTIAATTTDVPVVDAVNSAGVTATTAKVAWSSAAATFDVELRVGTRVVAAVSTNESSWSMEGLDPDTKYELRVRANPGDGSSVGAWSFTSFTTSEPPPPPPPPPVASRPSEDNGASCGQDSYINVDGNCVPRPSDTPSGASARCNDGSYSYSQNRRGTCSRHGGVAEWL